MMKKKGNFITNILFGIFLAVGIILLISGIVALVSNANFVKSAEEVTAQISNIDTYRDSDDELHHMVYVDFTYGGKIYTDVRLNFYSSSMYVGKNITILCDSTNPQNIRSKSGSYIAGILLIFMGVIFSLIGVVPILVTVRKSLRKKNVIASGRQLYATVEQIAFNTSYTVNGRHPYIIYCTYKDEYRDIIYRFKSENLWTNPNLVLKEGDSIRIYVDEKDYSNYHVDAESVFNGKVVDYT